MSQPPVLPNATSYHGGAKALSKGQGAAAMTCRHPSMGASRCVSCRRRAKRRTQSLLAGGLRW